MPASPARQHANMQNAQHSTCPRTAEGKDRSKQNATRHGLTSAAVLMPWEDPAEYEALLRKYTESYKPASDMEQDLLRRAVDACWRLRRAEAMETEFLIQQEDVIRERTFDGLTGNAALAALFDNPGDMQKLKLCMRYVAAARRTLTQTTKELEQVQRERKTHERERQTRQAVLSYLTEETQLPVTRPAMVASAAVGFVSQPNVPASSAPVTWPSTTNTVRAAIAMTAGDNHPERK